VRALRVLALETTTRAASCAVIEDGRLLGETYTDFKLKHSEKLMNITSHLLSDLHISLSDVSLLAISAGPGSFTGIRIGIATAKGFAHATGLGIIPISSLEAAAFQQSYFNGLICPIFDAQQSSVYTAAFDFKASRLRRLLADSAMSLDELLRRLPDGEDVLFCGDGVFKYQDSLASALGERAKFASPLTLLPHASSAALLAYERRDSVRHQSYAELQAAYIRPPQALTIEERRMRDASNQARGGGN